MSDDDVSLYVFRMEADPELGLHREPVTVTEYEEAVFHYTLHKLGDIFRKDAWCQVRLRLQDMNGTARPYAILAKRGAADFQEYTEYVNMYEYPPHGPASASLGYHSATTLGWIHPHRDGPALLFKPTQEAFAAAEIFMGQLMELGPVPVWPKVPPREMNGIISLGRVGGAPRPGALRKMRAAMKVRRALR